jgi:L-ascorbate metabolism protein UlaG (beta-lactamase superfamily)
MRLFARFGIAFLLVLALAPASAWAQNTEVTWFGHAAFQIKTPKGGVILIDPWLTNPANPKGKESLEKLDKADLILISHGHGDHVGDSVAIAKKTGAKFVGTADMSYVLPAHAGFPKDQIAMELAGNFGGEVAALAGEVTIQFVPAVHGSTFVDEKNLPHGAGNPGGFVISIQGGPTIYHTGDTAAFSDMKMIGENKQIDFMLACIGGHYTMDPQGAAQAAKLVNAGTIIPMHYGTFPLLKGTPDALEKALKKNKAKTKVRNLKIGEPVKL